MQRRWFSGTRTCREECSLFSSPLTSAGEGCNPVLGRLANAEHSCSSSMIYRRLFLSCERSLQEGNESPTFTCLILEAFLLQASRVSFFLFSSNSSFKSLWHFFLLVRLHWLLPIFDFLLETYFSS